MKLTEWVPQLAEQLRLPAALVHLRSQQIAKTYHIKWAMDMDPRDIEIFQATITAESEAGRSRAKARRVTK